MYITFCTRNSLLFDKGSIPEVKIILRLNSIDDVNKKNFCSTLQGNKGQQNQPHEIIIDKAKT